MNNVFIVRYGFEYEHTYILGVYEDKKDATRALKEFLEDSTAGFNECYIEKIKFTKKKKPNGKG